MSRSSATLSRRVLVVLGCLLAWATSRLPAEERAPDVQTITVTRLAGQGDDLPISVGIPLPPDTLRDARLVRVLNAKGDEVPAAAEPMLRWYGRASGLRAVRVQFRGAPGTYTFVLGSPRTAEAGGWPYAKGLVGGTPAALATLTPGWLTASLIAGPQSVAAPNEPYAAYVGAPSRLIPAMYQR